VIKIGIGSRIFAEPLSIKEDLAHLKSHATKKSAKDLKVLNAVA